MFDKKLISVTSQTLDPPVTNCSHHLGPPPPRAWRTLWTAPKRRTINQSIIV